mmetsp:Transcript_552/g.1723  ORF Transcript_552/g.1723 Transcript_552/m.1723 type:complete len:209 (-) Transcript_552:26-652(-)
MPGDGVPAGQDLKASLDWVFAVSKAPQQVAILSSRATGKQAAKAPRADLSKAPWSWEEGSGGAAPYDSNTDLLLHEDVGSMKVKLVKRTVAVSRKQYTKVWRPDFLEAAEFSARCSNPKGTRGNATGKGPYSLAIYYEPMKKLNVEKAFGTVGIDITNVAQEPVDAEPKDRIEAYLQYRHAIGVFGRFLALEGTELEVMRPGAGAPPP